MNIRDLKEEDLSLLLHWFNNPVALFLSSPESIYPYTQSSIKKELVELNDTYVFELNTQIVGCVSITKMGNRINHLFIQPKYRGNKYSKLLVQYILTKYKIASVYVHKNQREHLNLFKRLNFIETSEVFEFMFELNKEPFIKLVYNE